LLQPVLLHAWPTQARPPAAQSAAALQPQAPLTQACASVLAQFVQAPPPPPQASAREPLEQVAVPLVLSQQPPLQGALSLQPVALHLWLTQAVPVGQSLRSLQPHAWPTHAWPSFEEAQLTQALL
jgi:hypothetical protein